MSCFVGGVAGVPTADQLARIDQAERCRTSKVLEKGVLGMVGTWADDVADDEVTSFATAVRKQDDAKVVPSGVGWRDTAARNGAWSERAESRLDGMGEMLFEGRSMICGGFMPIVTMRA